MERRHHPNSVAAIHRLLRFLYRHRPQRCHPRPHLRSLGQPHWVDHQHHSACCLGGNAFGRLFGGLLGGRLYDRIPGHPLAATALLLVAFSLAIIPITPVLAILFVMEFVLGLAEGTADANL